MAKNAVQVIAEIGSVHDGSFGNAVQLIKLAAECGADAVKFQTHLAEAETLRDAPAPSFFRSEPRAEYFRRTGFSLDQWRSLKETCEAQQVLFLSSPFSEEAVDLLEQVGMSRYKIPSGEVTNLPLLEKVAKLGKPMILSSGMSSWGELDGAVEVIRRHHEHLTLLQCTSEYPCEYERVGLNVMSEMKARYGVPVGISDHTLTPYASLAAVALGASVVERHLTFSRKMYGSDARHSLEPDEFHDLVQGIRAVSLMLATPVKKDDLSRLQDMKRTFEKSLVTLAEIPGGAVITREMIGIKKPGTGIPPGQVNRVIGRRTSRALHADTLLKPEDIQGWDADA